jgi:predicted nucleic acid-binding protein
MATFTALYDACVLYPAPVRDLLMRLAMSDLFRARWTDQIHDEWIRHVLANRHDLKREQLERTRTLMNAHVRDCLVIGYEPLIDGPTLPDPEDRHVLAAAVRTGASVIVTFNLDDFPGEVLKPLGVEAQHPDEFITLENRQCATMFPSWLTLS